MSRSRKNLYPLYKRSLPHPTLQSLLPSNNWTLASLEYHPLKIHICNSHAKSLPRRLAHTVEAQVGLCHWRLQTLTKPLLPCFIQDALVYKRLKQPWLFTCRIFLKALALVVLKIKHSFWCTVIQQCFQTGTISMSAYNVHNSVAMPITQPGIRTSS